MKYAWIEVERKAYPSPVLCEVLGQHRWKGGGSPNRKRLSDAQMLALIRAID